MSRSDSSSRPADHALADRVAELADRIEAGEPVDLDVLRQVDPEVADRLLGLLPALDLLARLGRSDSSGRLASIGSLPPDDSGEGIGRLGEFILLRQIARGGMGVVFEARQQGIGRRVALKILPAVAALDPQQLRRFEVEVRAAGTLHHEHIVPVYSVGCDAGVHYYAMQLIEGRSLAQLITELRRSVPGAPELAETRAEGEVDDDSADGRDTLPDGPDLAPTQLDPSVLGPSHASFVARLGVQAAEALEHAHREEVVHRDIKPGNLLLDDDGRLWVADFGLARLQGDSSLTAPGVLVGTYRYMSPEQATASRRVPVDHRTDIYSLGATLYELLTLRLAFDDADGRVVLRRIIEDLPPSIRRLNPAVPIDLETVVSKAMARDPDDRYATAAELADDLRRFLEGRTVLARRPSPLDLAARWAYRHRLGVASAVVMLGLLTAALGVAVVLIAREQSRTAEALAEVKASRNDLIVARIRADEAARRARESERMAKELLYVADLKLAADALLDRDPLLMKEYLDRHVPEGDEPDLRDFAWWFLKTQGEMPFDELAGPGPALYFIAFSPDGRLMSTCGEDAVIRFYERPGDRLVLEIETGQKEVNCVAFSPDGRRLASAGDDGSVRLWDLQTGEQLRQIQAVEGAKAYQVAFVMDGDVLASCGEEEAIRLWDAATGVPIGSLWRERVGDRPRPVEAIAVSPDGRHLAAAGPGEVARVWDLESRAVSWERVAPGRPGWVAFTPDGSRVAVGRKKGNFEVADWRSGALVFDQKLRDDVESLAMLRGGSVLAASDRGGMIHLFPLPSPDGLSPGELRPSWLAHGDRLYALAATTDGEGLISAGADGLLRRWRPLEPDQSRRLLLGGDECLGFAIHPDGSEIWAGYANRAQARDIGRGTVGRQVPFPDQLLTALDFDRGGRLLAACGRETQEGTNRSLVVVRDLDDDVNLPLRWASPEGVHLPAIDLSPDGRRLAAYGGRGSEVPIGERVSLFLFDLEAGGPPLEVRMPHADSYGNSSMVAFSPNGGRLAVSDGKDVLIVDPATGETRRVLTGEHTGTVNALAFSPDGSMLASSAADRRLVLWDLGTGEPLLSTLALDAMALALAFSPDGRLLASAGRDAMVLLWHVPTRQLLMEIPAPNVHGGDSSYAYSTIAFGPNRRRLALLIPDDVLIFDTSPTASDP
jgi:WD40 repeat protein/serine/threonine protein kinase